MKYLKTFLIFCIALQSCIENDIIDDRVPEKLSINNKIEKITENTTYQLETKYTNNVGAIENPTITWNSNDTSILTVSNTGLLSAIKEGNAIITASTTSTEGTTVSTSINIMVSKEIIDNSEPKEKTGTIITTSSYKLTGTFTLKEIENTNDLELIVNADYDASTNLPGLYLYLTNNPKTVSNAKEVAAVTVFNGSHKYIIKDVGINDFSHLLYWCKPFGVKVGEATIN